MKLSLYNIQQEYISLAESIIDNDGLLSEEMEAALQINKDQLESKSQCYGFIVRQLEGECDMIDNEIKRLEAMKKSRGKTVDRLKESVSKAMQLYEIDKIETPTLKISFRKSESIEIEEESLIDEKYMTVKTTKTPDKKAIKEAIKAGEIVLGVTLKENQNIQFK
jgi:hypothetical protein